MVLSLKNVIFGKKTEKFLGWKIGQYDGEGVFFLEKKRFHLLKSLLYKNGKAQIMPLVAGRLVSNITFKREYFKLHFVTVFI